MKYIVSILSIIVIAVVLAFAGFKGNEKEPIEYLRVHIRANSNLEEDQKIKYMVKDAVVEALIPVLAEVETKAEAEKVLSKKFSYIQKVADAVLSKNGFNYKSKAYISNEYFPTRSYEGLTLESGFYDALILELGEGEGNNWWCVIYPAFCFLNSKNSANYVYISKIWEIINSVTTK